MKFREKSTTKKGEILEEIVRSWLIDRGYMPYRPAADGKHPVDFFVMHAKSKRFFAIDAKAKAKRRLFDDTGIDYRHFDTYFSIEKDYSCDVWLFFGDHNSGTVYGATLEELRRPVMNPPGCKPGHYPRIEGSIIYFPMSSMHHLFNLSDDQRCELADASKVVEMQRSFEI
jgi:hypothetical protein